MGSAKANRAICTEEEEELNWDIKACKLLYTRVIQNALQEMEHLKRAWDEPGSRVAFRQVVSWFRGDTYEARVALVTFKEACEILHLDRNRCLRKLARGGYLTEPDDEGNNRPHIVEPEEWHNLPRIIDRRRVAKVIRI